MGKNTLSVSQEPLRHNCGFCVARTLHDAYSFIKALQHRGREAAGIAFIGSNRIDVIKWSGIVRKFEITDLYNLFPSEKYHTYLAHVRYATKGSKTKILQEAHPHTIGGKVEDNKSHIIISDCDAVIVHNGQVGEEYLKIDKSKLNTNCDSEAILHKYLEEGVESLMKNIPGSFTMAIASKKRKEVLVLRDKHGIKPGALGIKDGKYIVASEDIAFRKNGGYFVEDLEPGCVYRLFPEGNYKKEKIIDPKPKHCFFEYNYLGDVDSIIDGISVRRLRELLGEALAGEFPLDADVVSFLPRCPEVAARRYAEKRKIPFIHIFYKTRSERSFLGSVEKDREKSINTNLFLTPNINGKDTKKFLEGKTIILLDDSTVRGNNSRRAIDLLKSKTNPKKIYLLNYTPKIGIIPEDNIPRGCLYGVDMPPNDNFVARNRTDKEISEKIGAETHFLSIESMLKAFEKLGMPRQNLCRFCIGGQNPF